MLVLLGLKVDRLDVGRVQSLNVDDAQRHLEEAVQGSVQSLLLALPRNFSMNWQSRSTLCSKESRSVMVLLKSAPEELSLARYVLSQLNRMF